MNVNKVKLIYFSPTGTTQKVLEHVADGIAAADVEHVNLTLPQGIDNITPLLSDELVILGAPVYGGRLPVEAVNRFRKLQAHNTLAIPIVVYGNREFEDALLELKNLAVELGFIPVAGGAFIGEHSYATQDAPIAVGRPDSRDQQMAMDSGAKIREKIAALHAPAAQMDLDIPGRFPYESSPRSMTIAPVTDTDLCTLCGICAGICPTAAITVSEKVTTATELCIRCCACIKGCPEGARHWEDPMIATITNWLKENCSTRKEPQVFGVDR